MYHDIANFNMLHGDVHAPFSLRTTASCHKINIQCERQVAGVEAYDVELQ